MKSANVVNLLIGLALYKVYRATFSLTFLHAEVFPRRWARVVALV